MAATTDLRVVREESEHGWFQMTFGVPAAPLRGLVRGYVGYRENSSVPVRRREVPTGDVTLILSFGPRIQVFDPVDREIVLHSVTSFVAPIDDKVAITEYTGEQFGLEITMSPLGAAQLLGARLDELADQVVDLEGVLGAEGRLLVERLADSPDWPDRFDVLDEAFLGLAARHRAPSPAAAWAWRRLDETEGRLTIASLVAELGCSHRYLVSEFRRHVGVPPKTLARVLRCQRAIRLLDRGTSIASTALDCGFSDQAHLNRDFRLITGLSPTSWLATVDPGSVSSKPIPAQGS